MALDKIAVVIKQYVPQFKVGIEGIRQRAHKVSGWKSNWSVRRRGH
jgi:hypothetical protein